MADSVSEQVGDIALAAVLAIGIVRPADGQPVPGVKRKLPAVPEGDTKGLPQFVVSVDGEGPTEYLTATQKLKRYPVAVTIVTAGGQQTGDDATVRKWRELIEKKLDARATWAGLTGWNEVNITSKPPFDVAALPKDFNFATVVAEVQVIEART